MKGIEILGFIRELEICKLNLRIGISETKFQRNWSFENYLRVWDFKKLNYENWDLEIKFWKKSELKIIWEVETMKIEL